MRPTDTVDFRHLWGQAKRAELTATAEDVPGALYEEFEPVLRLGLPFTPTVVSEDWFDWPSLSDLFSASFPGVTTSRDGLFVDVDLDRLRARVADYFNPTLRHEVIERRYPAIMKSTTRFDARAARDQMLRRTVPDEAEFIRYAYRPFDNRWLYWEKDGFRLDRPRADYRPHVFEGNMWIEARTRDTKEDFSRGTLVRHIASDFGNGRSHFFPAWLRDGAWATMMPAVVAPNLSATAQGYLDQLGCGVEDLFYHTLAILHDPAYHTAHANALRMEWPRIPLPGWLDGVIEDAAEKLTRSAAHGCELAALFDSDTPVPGVTQSPLRLEIATMAVPATTDGHNMTSEDFALIAGWGRYGKGNAVMPRKGRVDERAYTLDECAALGDALPVFGETTFDIYLNNHAFWSNVPAAIWTYKLGGYQVLKKWLSYREKDILGRALLPEEIQYFTDTVRRIAVVLLTITQNSSHKTG